MTKEELKAFYERIVNYYKGQIEFTTKQIKWYGRMLKYEKYDWGYSLQGERYIKQRNHEYRARKKAKLKLAEYEKLLNELLNEF